MQLIEAAHAARRPLALVDANDSFDPDGATNEQLAALLWVRCTGLEQAVHATDLLLRDGNLPLVVLDLMMCDGRQAQAVHSSTCHRLPTPRGRPWEHRARVYARANYGGH